MDLEEPGKLFGHKYSTITEAIDINNVIRCDKLPQADKTSFDTSQIMFIANFDLKMFSPNLW